MGYRARGTQAGLGGREKQVIVGMWGLEVPGFSRGLRPGPRVGRQVRWLRPQVGFHGGWPGLGRRSYTAPNHPGTPPCLCPLCDSEQWGLAGPCLTSVAHGPHALPPLQRQVEANVRNKILYLIQAWAHAFRNEPKYKVVQDTYQIMKVEGTS